MLKSVVGNNRGSVINIALLFLILLTTMVIFMSRVSTTDVQIAANEKAFTTAFYAADAGAYGSAKFVGKTLELSATPTFNAPGDDFPEVDFIITGGANDFEEQVMGFDTTDPDDNLQEFTDGVTGDEDIRFYLNGFRVNVGVTRGESRALIGGGAEFGAGSMGVGAGSSGGVAIYYAARSVAEGPKNSRAEINVEYRKIPGTAGGL